MKISVKSLLIPVSFILFAALLPAQTFTNESKWATYDDRYDGGSSTIGVQLGDKTMAGEEFFTVCMNGVVTDQCEYGFVGFSYTFTDYELDELATAQGIRFKALADGKEYRIRFETTDVQDYDYFGRTFRPRFGSVVEVEIPFARLRQEGWGSPQEFIQENIRAFSFQTVGQPHESVSLEVFDFQIY